MKLVSDQNPLALVVERYPAPLRRGEGSVCKDVCKRFQRQLGVHWSSVNAVERLYEPVFFRTSTQIPIFSTSSSVISSDVRS